MGDPEIGEGPQEILLKEDDVNDINRELVQKLGVILVDFAPPGFFEEGEAPSEMPLSFSAPTIDNDYTFTRIGRAYLHLNMGRLPAGETTSLLGEEGEIVCGEHPLSRHKIANQPPPGDNTPEATRANMQFVATLGSELALQGHAAN